MRWSDYNKHRTYLFQNSKARRNIVCNCFTVLRRVLVLLLAVEVKFDLCFYFSPVMRYNFFPEASGRIFSRR